MRLYIVSNSEECDNYHDFKTVEAISPNMAVQTYVETHGASGDHFLVSRVELKEYRACIISKDARAIFVTKV